MGLKHQEKDDVPERRLPPRPPWAPPPRAPPPRAASGVWEAEPGVLGEPPAQGPGQRALEHSSCSFLHHPGLRRARPVGEADPPPTVRLTALTAQPGRHVQCPRSGGGTLGEGREDKPQRGRPGPRWAGGRRRPRRAVLSGPRLRWAGGSGRAACPARGRRVARATRRHVWEAGSRARPRVCQQEEVIPGAAIPERGRPRSSGTGVGVIPCSHAPSCGLSQAGGKCQNQELRPPPPTRSSQPRCVLSAAAISLYTRGH